MRYIRDVLCGAVLAIIVAISVIERDPWYLDHASDLVSSFYAAAYQCHMDCRVAHCNVLSGSFTLVDAHAHAHNGSWQWSSKQIKISFSWWELCAYAALMVDLEIDGLSVFSRTHIGYPLVMNHLFDLVALANNGISSTVQSLVVRDAHVVLHDQPTHITASADGSLLLRKMNRMTRAYIHVNDGSLSCADIPIFTKAHISNELIITEHRTGPRISLSTQGTTMCESLAQSEQMCAIHGNWEHTKGAWSVYNHTGSVRADAAISEQAARVYDVEGAAVCQLQHLSRVAQLYGLTVPISGNAHWAFAARCGEAVNSKSTLMCNNMRIADYPIAEWVLLKTHGRNTDIRGNYEMGNVDISYAGNIRADLAQAQYKISLTNAAVTMVPYTKWVCAPGEMRLKLLRDASGLYLATARARMEHMLTRENAEVASTASLLESKFDMSGNCGAYGYSCTGNYVDAMPVHTLQVVMQDAPLITGVRDAHESLFTTIIAQRCISDTLNAVGIPAYGEGDMQIAVRSEPYGYSAQAQLLDKACWLVQSYNVLKKFNAAMHYDRSRKAFFIDRCRGVLHRGEINVPHGFICHDGVRITAASCPLIFDRCLFHYGKELFATVSGVFNLSHNKKNTSAMRCIGSCVIDRAHMSGNPIALTPTHQNIACTPWYESFLRSCVADVLCMTQQPIQVKTPFLTTQVSADVRATIADGQPKINGDLLLHGGAVHFPYKSLDIIKGKLTLNGAHYANPFVEFVAKGLVKHYGVRMRVSGPLQDHQVTFDATPPLTEQQIITLLLLGSDQESLNILVPAFISKNISTMLFGSGSALTRLHDHIKKILPFKRISIIPSFTDQTGRGGLRGALEIEVNDRWRALIQRNFSLPEDTRFEIEYQATDDIVIRGVRDERRDVGVEVEMRWKM